MGQLRVEMSTEIRLGGWSETRSHQRTGQDVGEAGRTGSGREGEERGWKKRGFFAG